MSDDLRQPLRRQTFADRLKRLKPSLLQIVAAGSVVAAIGGVGWLYHLDVPFAGQSVVRQTIGPLEKLATAKTPDPAKKSPVIENKTPPPDTLPPDNVPPEPDPADVAADRDEANRQRVAVIQRPGRLTAKPLRRAPVKAVSERGPFGLLPRRARSGKGPFEVYSAQVPNRVLRSGRPKVAVLITGMGINGKLTEQAIRELPGQISFAFAPYGKGLQNEINRARARGHEVMLHIPMEPFGYPGVNPGPRTLLASADATKNIESLKWLMSRVTGYVGVTNYMGAKFRSDGGALLPVFAQFHKRGLVYFDDGTNDGALTASIAQAVKLKARIGDVMLDDIGQDYASVQRALANLEAAARRNGVAVASGTGLGPVIDAVENWSRDLSGRGFTLVPISVAYKLAKKK